MKTLLLVLVLLATGCAGRDRPTSHAPAPDDAASGPAISHPTPREHQGWSVVARSRADLDGDGARDEVRVREPDDLHGIEVAVELADRTVVRPMPRTSSLDFQPFEQADVDGFPGEELFVMHEIPVRTFSTLTWRDDRFVEIPAPPHRPLTDDYAPDVHARGWWVDGTRLVSYRSRVACDAGYDFVSCPARMQVDAQQWRVVDGRWRVEPLGRFCVASARPEHLMPCTG